MILIVVRQMCLLSAFLVMLTERTFAMQLTGFFQEESLVHTEPYHPRANKPYCIKKQCFRPDVSLKNFKEQGVASWYGHPFHGRRTSTGERYNMYSLTAASTSLPIPSYARVTNLENKKSVIVRINDRGPFIKGRILDLSYGAAHRLGFAHQGTARVHVEWIHPQRLKQHLGESPKKQMTQKHLPRHPLLSTTALQTTKKHTKSQPPQAPQLIQIGFFKHPAFAQKFSQEMRTRYPELPIHIRENPHGFRIVVGPIPSHSTQPTLQLLQKRLPESFVVHSSS